MSQHRGRGLQQRRPARSVRRHRRRPGAVRQPAGTFAKHRRVTLAAGPFTQGRLARLRPRLRCGPRPAGRERRSCCATTGRPGSATSTADFPFVRGRAIDGVAVRPGADTPGHATSPSAYADRARRRLPRPAGGQVRGRAAEPRYRRARGRCSRRTSTTTAAADLVGAGRTRRSCCSARRAVHRGDGRGTEGDDRGARGFREPRGRDLVAGGVVLRNRGEGRFDGRRRRRARERRGRSSTADFDDDGRVDLAGVRPDGSLHLLTNNTATTNTLARAWR